LFTFINNNFNEFSEFGKSLEGWTGQINMDFVSTEIDRDFAFIIVKFDAVWSKEPSKMVFKTTENYILNKVDGKWLIHFWHSI